MVDCNLKQQGLPTVGKGLLVQGLSPQTKHRRLSGVVVQRSHDQVQ